MHLVKREVGVLYQQTLLYILSPPPLATVMALGEPEDQKESRREDRSGDGRCLLGQNVDHRQAEQHEQDQDEPQRDLGSTDAEIERRLPLLRTRTLVPKNHHREALQRKAPDHSESVRLAEHNYVRA